MTIARIVATLQGQIRSGSLTCSNVQALTSELSSLGYSYDQALFPPLPEPGELSITPIASSPENLAEALLWKMGKWKIYKQFVANFQSANPITKKTDVVFAAFAKHLKDRAKPIYDQHTLRALWAVKNLSDHEYSQCKSALLMLRGERSGGWRQNLAGGSTIACYELYVKHVGELVALKDGPSMGDLDKLLMPLGQALKSSSNSYAEFRELCGRGA